MNNEPSLQQQQQQQHWFNLLSNKEQMNKQTDARLSSILSGPQTVLALTSGATEQHKHMGDYT